MEIEQEIGLGMTLTAGYQYARGVHLIISVNQNVPSCVAAGSNNGCRPNAAYANNSQYSPSASSAYHGVHVSLVRRPQGQADRCLAQVRIGKAGAWTR